MLMDDDLEPTNRPKKPKPLDGMSVEELRTYIDALKAEITRVEAVMTAKSAHLAAAAALFKQPG